MKTIDIHSHLLSPNVKFNRMFDKMSLFLFAKRLGIKDIDALHNDPYNEYKKIFINNIRTSKYITKAVVLPVDAKIDKNQKILHMDKTVCSNNEDIWKFHKEYPNETIPFFSVNPMRDDALDRIDEYASRGFKGAKFLQNYWEVDSNDEKYIPYYEKLKKYDLPIIIHTGSEFTMPSNKEYEKVDMVILPAELGVKTIAAHMGLTILKTPYFWKNFSSYPNNYDTSYFKLINMLKKYPTLYADLSATIIPFRARVLKDLATNRTHIHDKLLFGTDYPVPFSPYFSYGLSFKEKQRLNTIKNPLDCYLEIIKIYFNQNNLIFENYKKVIK